MTERERAITELQQYLRNISRNESDKPAIIPDGVYSEETKKAVEDFQRQTGLEVNGIVNFETWEGLVRANRRAVYENTLPVQIAPIRNEDLPLKRGDSGSLVKTLKLMLDSVADSYGNFNRSTEGDLFDEATEREVIRWQGIAFIGDNGEVNRETWDSLARFYLLQ